MRDLIQLVSVIVIALGAALYAYGRHLDPPLSAINPAAVLHINEYTHNVAAAARGWGIGFISLGVLSLAVPWINICVHKHYERVNSPAI